MYLCSKRYEQIKKSVARVLREYSDLTFPIDLNQIIENIPNLSVVYYSEKPELSDNCLKRISSDGFGLAMPDGTYTIYVNNQEYVPRGRFSTGHEVGHFSLGHDSKLKSGRISQEEAEAEADFFAAKLLVPDWAVDYLETKDIYSISEAFGVSYECAYYRLKSYQSWVCKGRPMNSIEEEISWLTQFNNISPTFPTLTNNPFQESLYA